MPIRRQFYVSELSERLREYCSANAGVLRRSAVMLSRSPEAEVVMLKRCAGMLSRSPEAEIVIIAESSSKI